MPSNGAIYKSADALARFAICCPLPYIDEELPPNVFFHHTIYHQRWCGCVAQFVQSTAAATVAAATVAALTYQNCCSFITMWLSFWYCTTTSGHNGKCIFDTYYSEWWWWMWWWVWPSFSSLRLLLFFFVQLFHLAFLFAVLLLFFARNSFSCP